MKLNEWVLAARKHKRWSQTELGDALGVTKGNVSAWENDRHAPSFAQVLKTSELTGWPMPPAAEPDGQSTADPAITPTLPQALEVLGMALAHDLPADVRDDVADALAKLAQRRGAERDQETVLRLLQEGGTGKRLTAA